MSDSTKPSGKSLADTPITDLFADGRRPSESEQQ